MTQRNKWLMISAWPPFSVHDPALPSSEKNRLTPMELYYRCRGCTFPGASDLIIAGRFSARSVSRPELQGENRSRWPLHYVSSDALLSLDQFSRFAGSSILLNFCCYMAAGIRFVLTPRCLWLEVFKVELIYDGSSPLAKRMQSQTFDSMLLCKK